MNRITKTLIAALLGACLLVGCKSADEKTPEATPPAPTSTAGSETKMPSRDAVESMDFSSAESIQSTVVPALKGMLAYNPNLSGTTLDVELKDKVLHVKGDVRNNDQKRAIDDVIKPLLEKAKAAGINILNGAIVKG